MEHLRALKIVTSCIANKFTPGVFAKCTPSFVLGFAEDQTTGALTYMARVKATEPQAGLATLLNQ